MSHFTPEERIEHIRRIIQVDPGNRGLAAPGDRNAFSVRAEDLNRGALSLISPPEDNFRTRVGIITGFSIPTEEFSAFETDGPPGALFLARTLQKLGMDVVLFGESSLLVALEAGLIQSGTAGTIRLVELPRDAYESGPYSRRFHTSAGRLTHLVFIERPGPSHTLAALRNRPDYHIDWDFDFKKVAPPITRDRYLTMSGIDVTVNHSQAHWILDHPNPHGAWHTIGIGDGGNEMGMGALPWDMVNATIPLGGRIQCRVPTESLIVSGVSNWGAYGLAAACLGLVNQGPIPEIFDPEAEYAILEAMVNQGGLIDGRTTLPEATVDGLDWPHHAQVLSDLSQAIS